MFLFTKIFMVYLGISTLSISRSRFLKVHPRLITIQHHLEVSFLSSKCGIGNKLAKSELLFIPSKNLHVNVQTSCAMIPCSFGLENWLLWYFPRVHGLLDHPYTNKVMKDVLRTRWNMWVGLLDHLQSMERVQGNWKHFQIIE